MSVAIKHMKGRLEAADNEGLVKSLWNTALDRLAINSVAAALNSFLNDEIKNESVAELLETAVDFSKKHKEEDNLKKYLVRYIACKFQREAIAEWKKKEIYPELLPDTLRLSDPDTAPDIFLLISKDYRAVRKTLNMSWISCNFDDLGQLARNLQNQPLLWRLAFYYLTRINPCQVSIL
jgi:hypothetical protein